MKLLNIAVTWLLGMALVIPLVGCEGERQNASIRATSEFKLSELMRADVVPVSPEQVSEAFALGSDSTDLQREILRKELIGKVIEWDVRVYEIAYADGVSRSRPSRFRSNPSRQ